MPIRWRLTLWFALLVCVILVLVGSLLHVLVQRYLDNEVDNDLRIYSARVHGTLNPKRIPEPLDYDIIHAQLPAINEFTSPGIYIQFIDKDANVVIKSNNLGDRELPISRSLINDGFNGRVAIETVSAGEGARIRIIVSPMYLTDETVLLEVAQSLEPIDAIMSQVRLALLISIILALILVVISGAVVIRRALSPVKHITTTARNIGASSDLSQRVGYTGPMDEIGKLGMTFDQMIEKLDRVFQSQKFFVADASHELRSPLTVIKGNLDLIKRNLGEKDRAEALRAITIETDRMVKIVDDLLILAEVESGNIEHQEVVSLKKVLSSEAERASRLTGNRKIIIEQQEDLTIKGDSHRLKLLFWNLIDNAIKYTDDGGIIRLSLYRDNEWACLEIADTGKGIESYHLTNIFDRFYRTDKVRTRAQGRGIGLGLAIVKGIAEQHGGKVTVKSEPGKGSVFTVFLKL